MNLSEFRQNYPGYNDISDDDLTKSLHQKYYSDLPFDEFRKTFVGAQETIAAPATTTSTAAHVIGQVSGGILDTTAQAAKGVARAMTPTGAELEPSAANWAITAPPRETYREYRERTKDVAPDNFDERLTESPLWKGAEWIEEQAKGIPVKPGLEDNFLATDVPRGFGSAAAFVPLMATTRLGLSEKLTGAEALVAGVKEGTRSGLGWTGASGLVGAAAEAGGQLTEGMKKGLKPSELDWPYLLGGAVGTTEMVPLEVGLRFLGKYATKGMLARMGIASLAGGITNVIQEAAQQIGDNLIAQRYYDPNRSWDEGVIKAAGVGGIVGAGMGAGAAPFVKPEVKGKIKLTPMDFVGEEFVGPPEELVGPEQPYVAPPTTTPAPEIKELSPTQLKASEASIAKQTEGAAPAPELRTYPNLTVEGAPLPYQPSIEPTPKVTQKVGETPTGTVTELESLLAPLDKEANSLRGIIYEGSPLRTALETATGFWSESDALESFKWALQNGRPDIAKALLARAESMANTASTEPGVSKDNPKYNEIKNKLLEIAKERSNFAGQLRNLMRLLGTNEPATVQTPAGASATPALGQEPGQVGGRVPPPLLTEHPVQVALQEVYGDAGTAAMEADRLGPSLGVNFHPVETSPGVWQLRLGKEKLEDTASEYEAFLDELETSQETAKGASKQMLGRIRNEVARNKAAYDLAEGGPFNLDEFFIQGEQEAKVEPEVTPEAVETGVPATTGQEGVEKKPVSNIQAIREAAERRAGLKRLGGLTEQDKMLREMEDKQRQMLEAETIQSTRENKKISTAILAQAIRDIYDAAKAKIVPGSKLFKDKETAELARNARTAREWLSERGSDDPYSFESICETLGLEPEMVQNGIEKGVVDPKELMDTTRLYSGLGFLPKAFEEMGSLVSEMSKPIRSGTWKLKSNTRQLSTMEAKNVGNVDINRSYANELFQNALDNPLPGKKQDIDIKLYNSKEVRELPDGWKWKDPKTFWDSSNEEPLPFLAVKYEADGSIHIAIEGYSKNDVLSQVGAKEPLKITQENPILIFRDRGTGMTPEVVEDQFLMLGGVGTKGELSRGGFGIASAFLIKHPDSIYLDTVAKVGDKKIRTQFKGTYEQIIEGTAPFKISEVPANTVTGTTYKAYLPNDMDMYDLEDAFKQYIKELRVPSKVSFKGRYTSNENFELAKKGELEEERYGNSILIHTVEDFSELEDVAPSIKFVDDSGKNKGTIYFKSARVARNAWANSEGLYPVDARVYNKGLPLNMTIRNLGVFPAKPHFEVLVDFERTSSPETDMDNYPFMDNRTTLMPSIERMLQNKAVATIRDMAHGVHAKNVQKYKDMVANSPVIDGVKFIMDFEDPADNVLARKIIRDYMPIFKQYTSIFKDFLKTLTDLGEPHVDFMFTLDPGEKKGTYGFKPRKAVTGLDLIAINPVKMSIGLISGNERLERVIRRGRRPSDVQAAFFAHALMHEYAHNKQENHYDQYCWELAELYAALTHETGVTPIERSARELFENHATELAKLSEDLGAIKSKSILRTAGANLRDFAGGATGQPNEQYAVGGREETGGTGTGTGTEFYSGLGFLSKLFEQPKTMVNDLLNKDVEKLPGGGLGNWISRRYSQHLRLPQWVARIKKDFQPFYAVATNRQSEAMAGVSQALDKIGSWSSLSEQERANCVSLIKQIEGKQLKATPSPEFDFYVENGIRRAKKNPNHVREFEAFLKSKGLSEKEVGFLVDFKTGFNDAFVDHYNTLSHMDGIDEESLNDLMRHVGQIPNYFPHMWEGGYYVDGVDSNGKVVARVNVPVGAITWGLGRKIGMKRFIKGLKDNPLYEGLTWDTEPKSVSELDKFWLNSPVPLDTLERLLDESAKRLEENEELAPLAQAYRKIIPKETIRILKTRGFGNFAERKGILGYERDNITKVYYDYMNGVYSTLAKLKAAKSYTELMFQTKPNAEDYKLFAEFVEDEMSPYSEFDRFSDNARALFFARWLGWRLKPAVINLTNMSSSAIPMLGIYTKGAASSTVLNGTAMKDVASQWKQEFPVHRKSVGIKGAATKNVLTPDEIRMNVDLYTDSTIQHQMMNEYSRELRDVGSWTIQSTINKAGFGLPMQMTEWFMRASTALASFRAFKDGKITHGPTLERFGLVEGQPVDMSEEGNYQKALEFTREIVDGAYGDFTHFNKPPVLRQGKFGALGRMFYTFQFYPHHLMEMWNWMLRHEETGRGKMAFAKSMIGNALAGGLKRAPIAALIFWMFQKWDKEDPEAKLREKFPNMNRLWDAAFEGAPGLGGVYIGGSLEIGFPSNVEEALGIPGAAVKDVLNGLDAWTSGNRKKAMEYLAPLVVARDLLSAYRGYTSGERTIGGKPINVPGEVEPSMLTFPEAIAKGLGFRPLSTEKRWRLSESVAELEDVRKAAQSKYADRYMNAIADGRYELAEKVLEEVIAYNEIWLSKGREEMVITMDNLNSALGSRAEVKKPSKQLGAKTLRMIEGFGLQPSTSASTP